MALTVLRRPLLVEGLEVVVIEVGLVEEDHILLFGDEVTAGAVLTLLVDELRNAQQFGHTVLVVDEVTPLHAGLEHHLHPVARGRDIHHLDANLRQVEMGGNLLPPTAHIVGVVAADHMVEVHHTEAVQTQALLLTPATQLGCLLGLAGLLMGIAQRLVEIAHEDHQREAALQTVGPGQGQLLRGLTLQGLALLGLQLLKPLLVFSLHGPVAGGGRGLDLADEVHLMGVVVVTEQTYEQVMAHVLCRFEK